MGENGWSFEPGPGVIPDPIHQVDFLRTIYTKANPTYTGRVTVPVLWDKQTNTVVNNESSEIIRMFNHIKSHYYQSHDQVNPTRIVPAGPELDLGAPHGRG